MGPQGQAVRLGAFANNTDAADVETADSTERSGKRKDLILSFHSLKPSTDQSVSVVPWKLQVTQRSHDAWWILLGLLHNSVWRLAGLHLKRFSLKPSALMEELKATLK